MTAAQERSPSPRRQELLEAAYRYVQRHGISPMSLRPLAAAIGTSPRVLLFLFGSKEGLIRALLLRSRVDELALLDQLRQRRAATPDLAAVGMEIWQWLAADERRALLKLWVEGYARALIDPAGPWADFAQDSVRDWLDVLARFQPAGQRRSRAGLARRTEVLAILRGALLDLLATGDRERTTGAVRQALG